MSATFGIIHEVPGAGASQMEVARVEAESEEAALLAWHPQAARVSEHEGSPCLNFGFGDIVLRRYTAVQR